MRVSPSAAFLFLVTGTVSVAHADTFDTITFSFPLTSIPQPYGNPPDVVSAISHTVIVPASPTPVLEPSFPPDPTSFWIDPYGNPVGQYPPPGDISYYFSPGGAGYVFTENLLSPRAYYSFKSPQLFAGPASAPTFLLGIFAAQYSVPIFGYGYDFGTITIAANSTPPPSTVPEPGSLALLSTGLLGVAFLLHRRTRAV